MNTAHHRATISYLPSGRRVLDTGKVQIGLRAGEQRTPRPATASAQIIQDALRTVPHSVIAFGGAMKPPAANDSILPGSTASPAPRIPRHRAPVRRRAGRISPRTLRVADITAAFLTIGGAGALVALVITALTRAA